MSRPTNVLPWRPRSPSVQPITVSPSRLWKMRKDSWQIECLLQDCGPQGWSVQVLLNDQSFFRSRFRAWVDAIESAEDRYAALVQTGWTPVPLDHDSHGNFG